MKNCSSSLHALTPPPRAFSCVIIHEHDGSGIRMDKDGQGWNTSEKHQRKQTLHGRGKTGKQKSYKKSVPLTKIRKIMLKNVSTREKITQSVKIKQDRMRQRQQVQSTWPLTLFSSSLLYKPGCRLCFAVLPASSKIPSPSPCPLLIPRLGSI